MVFGTISNILILNMFSLHEMPNNSFGEGREDNKMLMMCVKFHSLWLQGCNFNSKLKLFFSHKASKCTCLMYVVTHLISLDSSIAS